MGGGSNWGLRIGGAVLGLVLLAAMPASTTFRNTSDTLLNERCVMCHPGVFNAGMTQPFRHDPFLQRRCATCHVEDSSSLKPEEPSPLLTGAVVDQEPMLARRFVIPAGGEKDTDHLVALEGLPPTQTFRFRFLLNQDNPVQDEATVKSQWLGLIPAEINRFSSAEPHILVRDIDSKTAGQVSQLVLCCNEPSVVLVAWRTPEPGFSWIELEQLPERQDNDGPTTLTERAGGKGHPRLRKPQDLAITVCYTCHAKKTLGTSHPVSIQARSGSSMIPEELPLGEDNSMTCVTCHNPHGTLCRSLVRDTVETKLCSACHLDQQKKVSLNLNTLLH